MIDRLMSALMGSKGDCGCSGSGHKSDAHMISKSLDSLAAQATELRKRMECGGGELPSWAEYKVYKAHDAIKDALSSTFSMEPSVRPKVMMIIRKSHDMGAKDAIEAAGLSKSVAGE